MTVTVTVTVHKAEGVGYIPTPDLHVEALREFPRLPDGARLDEYRVRFAADAKILADALYATLPGGTLDQLLRELLERRASLFVVRF